MVFFTPSSKETFGFHLVNFFAVFELHRSLGVSPLLKLFENFNFEFEFHNSIMNFANFLFSISFPVPKFITFPSIFGIKPNFEYASTASLTYV